MKYKLMNAEHEVLEFETDNRDSINIIRILDEFKYAPMHFSRHFQDMEKLNYDLISFILSRTINSARSDAKDIFAGVGVNDNIALSMRSLGLSLSASHCSQKLEIHPKGILSEKRWLCKGTGQGGV